MEKIKLSNGKCTAEIQLQGAQITSFHGPDGREVIWQADPSVWASHAPVLFPICGSVADGVIRIEGKPYTMPKHGFSRKPEYEVLKQGDDFVELALYPSEETRAMYPFDFVFHVTYTLLENGYVTAFTVENNSDRVMPFCVGGHPAFIVPMEEGARFTDYQLVFPQVEEGKNLLAPGGYLISGFEYMDCFHNSDTLPLSHKLFDEHDALIFADLKSRSVKLVNRNSGKGLLFEFPKLEVLAVWTMPGKHAPYVCLEPWHGMPATVEESGDFENKPFATLLEPGRSWQASFTTTLID
ncbi:MAG: aldose 1-epimerase family protein [Clostridia bacterium]|nr:aldose 1-epimerase family protein [Clostridia bacterium]